jgi:hypothetical protein
MVEGVAQVGLTAVVEEHAVMLLDLVLRTGAWPRRGDTSIHPCPLLVGRSVPCRCV